FTPVNSGPVLLLDSGKYLVQLFARCRSMLARIVAIPFPPEGTPNHPQGSEQEERHSPSRKRHDRHDQWRRERTAEARAHEQNAVSISNFALRKPPGETSRDGRERAGFTDAEQQSRDQENRKVPGQSCSCGEYRPPDH